MRRSFPPLAWLLLIATVVGVAAWFLRPRPQNTSRYQTREVSRGTITETVITTGTVQPLRTVNVGSQISGIVLKLLADYNTPVTKGQIIALMDPSALRQQERGAQATLEADQFAERSAIANLQNAISNQDVAQEAIATAQATLAAATAQYSTALAQARAADAALRKNRAQLYIAERNWDRARQLVSQGLMTIADYDTASSNDRAAVADVQNGEATVQSARSNAANARAGVENARTALASSRLKKRAADTLVSAAQAQVQSARAQIRKAQADLAGIDINLGYTTVRSPVDGVIIARLVDEGQTVAASFQTPNLFTIGTDLTHMQVYATVDEGDISRVYPGQKGSFQVDAWPDEDFPCKVAVIRQNPVSIQNVVTYQVLADVDNRALKLKPGMTANLSLIVSSKTDALRIPNVALRYHPPGTPAITKHGTGRVYRLVAGGPVATDVTLGITDGINTEMVTGPLVAGQALIVAARAPQTTASGTAAAPVRMPH